MFLDPRRVKPFDDQPRKRFRGIKQLAASIQAVGQVTPISVTPLENDAEYDAQLTDGERRLKACLLLGRKIKAVWEDNGDAAAGSRFARAVAANMCRQEHDAIEISEAVYALKAEGRSVEEIMAIFGKSNCWVYQHMQLAGLAGEVRDMLIRRGDEVKQDRRKKGKISLSLALLLTHFDHGTQLKAARKILKEEMSIHAARNYIARLERKSKSAALPGGPRKRQTQSPRQKWCVLMNGTDTFANIVERHATQTHGELTAVLDAAGSTELRVILRWWDKLREDLDGLRSAVRRRLSQ